MIEQLQVSLEGRISALCKTIKLHANELQAVIRNQQAYRRSEDTPAEEMLELFGVWGTLNMHVSDLDNACYQIVKYNSQLTQVLEKQVEAIDRNEPGDH